MAKEIVMPKLGRTMTEGTVMVRPSLGITISFAMVFLLISSFRLFCMERA